MPNLKPKETASKEINSPYEISWSRLGKFVTPPILIILGIALWFVYLYIPSNISLQNKDTFIPEVKTTKTSGEKNDVINISKLLLNPKNYSGKELCVRGYYYQAFESSALLDSYNYPEKNIGEYSTWVVNETGRDIITENTGSEAVRDIVACGLFETGENYGLIKSYQNQLTLKSFTPKGGAIFLNTLD